MKSLAKLTLGLSAIWCCFAAPAFGFNSGSTGTEDLIVTADTTLDLPDDGVLQYKNIHVQSGTTLTFKKNLKNTPVTILASEQVTIEGTIRVSGGKGSFILPGVGGPGGFDGGTGGVVGKAGFRGEGPGGGYGGMGNVNYEYSGASGGGGGHGAAGMKGSNAYAYPANAGGNGGASYGNERVIPLVGGSGGGGGGGSSKYCGGGGGGGGGAILIAASGTINIAGGIYADGGAGNGGEKVVSSAGNSGGSGGGGAGGAIRLVATTIMGNGVLSAAGGGSDPAYHFFYGGTGGQGRIRLEAEHLQRTSSTNPPLTVGPAYALYPPGLPSLKILSINGVATPEIISGKFSSPDVTLPFNTNNPVTVVVAGANLHSGSTVTLEVHSAAGNTQSVSGTLAGAYASTTASIDVNISTSVPSVITAYVTINADLAFNQPMYIDGEMVAQVRVASSLGEASAMTYILESGREVQAYL